MPIPLPGDYPGFCQPYIDLAQADDFAALALQAANDLQYFMNIPADKAHDRYAPGKWTVNEVIQHLIDTDRIYSYRAMVIARGEPTVLHTVDEIRYTAESGANQRSLVSLIEELVAVRRASDSLFLHLSAQQLERSGYVGDSFYTVNSLGYYLYGHLHHHRQVLAGLYGV